MSRLPWLVLPSLAVLLSAFQTQSKVDFNRQIRPILSDTCFACHGPDEKTRLVNLRFDEKASALQVVAPGSRGQSKLYQRITDPDPKRRMPPPGAARTLTKEQVELIGRWIDEGAEWRTHWAYSAPRRPEPPEVKDKAWRKNAIDDYVLAKLENAGLRPALPADKATLIRRVTLDLTGLPPSPSEVQAFLNDRSPDAYEKVVERLLASPHYGERMTMMWLDLARYADTHGYHIDSHRDMWPWREWVIRAFNSNMPFDRFTIEQLAGDLLPNPTRDQKLATGFNRNHMINYEGGAIPEEYHVEYIVDRVEATANTWMSMTMGCARCHDHKYDPISQRDFYRFFAFFHNIDEKGLDGKEGNAKPILPLPDEIQQARLTEIEQAIQSREKALPEKETGAALEAWAKTAEPSGGPRGALAHFDLDGTFSDLSGNYRHARLIAGNPTFSSGPSGQSLSFDGETQVDWGAFDADTFTAAFWLRLNNKLEQAILHRGAGSFLIRLEEAISIGDLKRGARLRVKLGDSLELRSRKHIVQGEWTHVAVTYDGRVTLYLDGEPAEVEILREQPSGAMAGGASWGTGDKAVDKPLRSQLDDVRFYPRVLTAGEVRQLAVDAPVRGILHTPAARRTRDQKDRLRDYFLTYAAGDAQRHAYAELKLLRSAREKLDKEVVTSMVMDELKKPRETYILARGDYRNKTEKVTPAVPSSLPPLPQGAPLNRLGLAQWLVDPSHPLTSRVAVNRFWQICFGAGLVETSEDFGSQGSPPTHVELLDWLATEFIRTGWDVKALQRLIVTSATYRQSSKATPELIERDPQNKLLARMSRFRLPAEVVRDNALSISGLLNRDVGGPSVFPYQSPVLWEEMAYGDVFSAQTYVESHGKDLYRRSMYTFWKRTVPPASLATFDAPDREKCVARRARTNTPLQALVLMNDPTYVEAARTLAEKVLAGSRPSSSARITMAYQLAAARSPAPSEVKLLAQLAEKQRAIYRRDPDSARKLIAVGESKPAANLDPVELAAWTTVASAVLNLDEVITKE
ncbi:MAG: DUF1553 domain-containing protein [Acidobacteria bacterium]|nr:DUF1553 domain-containing protein [Acidobacteriota bacterium]